MRIKLFFELENNKLTVNYRKRNNKLDKTFCAGI